MSNIAYLRVSHIESLNGTSLETQENKCKAYAELHDFKIDRVYSEVVSGAVEFRKRPVFQKVLSELKGNSKLVVSRLDRLSRKVVYTLKLIDDFKKEEGLTIPKTINFKKVGSLSNEIVEKLSKTRPPTLGAASRISGVTPAAIIAIMRFLKKQKNNKAA